MSDSNLPAEYELLLEPLRLDNKVELTALHDLVTPLISKAKMSHVFIMYDVCATHSTFRCLKHMTKHELAMYYSLQA